jgi:hypothetical protein
MQTAAPILKFPSQPASPAATIDAADRVWDFDAETIAGLAATGEDVAVCLMPDGRLLMVVRRPDLEAHAARTPS